jgi:hypothetical protein
MIVQRVNSNDPIASSCIASMVKSTLGQHVRAKAEVARLKHEEYQMQKDDRQARRVLGYLTLNRARSSTNHERATPQHQRGGLHHAVDYDPHQLHCSTTTWGSGLATADIYTALSS